MFVDANAVHALFGRTSQKKRLPKKGRADDKGISCYPLSLLWFTGALVLRCLRRTGISGEQGITQKAL
jgi:hypothetical protein